MVENELPGWLVIHAHLSNYKALVEVESAKGFLGPAVAADYWANYCEPTVKRMCRKSGAPPEYR
jgi:hypothetical protein